MESATKGGDVNLWVGVDENEQQVNSEINEFGNGDIIVSDSAEIDISGGGVLYDSGYLQTTKLLAPDRKIYDISDAPDNLTDYRVLTRQTFSNPKYGNATISGLFLRWFDASLRLRRPLHPGERRRFIVVNWPDGYTERCSEWPGDKRTLPDRRR